MQLPYDPAILLLDIFSKKIKTRIQKDIWIPMFIAAQFTVANIWKPTKCPSADEWIQRMFSTHSHSGILLSHEKE